MTLPAGGEKMQHLVWIAEVHDMHSWLELSEKERRQPYGDNATTASKPVEDSLMAGCTDTMSAFFG